MIIGDSFSNVLVIPFVVWAILDYLVGKHFFWYRFIVSLTLWGTLKALKKKKKKIFLNGNFLN